MLNVTINADDYGWSKSCSLAILEAYEKKYITTTTMMSTGDFFDEAVKLIRESGLKDHVGIHFDLTEGVPLTSRIRNEPFFCDSNGIFHMHVNWHVPLNKKQKDCVYEELCAQAERFIKTGLKVHHADSHHHIHTAPFIYPIYKKVVDDYGIEKIRISRNIGKMSFKTKVARSLIFNHLFIGNKRAYSNFFCFFEDISAINNKSGVLEIMCHPDYDEKGRLIDRDGESSYDSPFGLELKDLLETLNKKKVRVLFNV